MKYSFPVYKPSLSGNEKKYVNDCLESTWISGKGKYIDEFEERFAGFIQAENATSVCNGTVALHLALVALGIGLEDEVIVPTLTYVASVNAISYTGAKPVFVDSLWDSWQMDPEEVKRKITPRTKAVLAVHLYGHPCAMDALVDICRKNNLFLIEDCAEALGTSYKNQFAGTFGDISTFSFYGNKTITTGEGGMVVTSDKTLHDRVVHFKGQGLAKHREYWHDVVGYNYRMSNISAAIGLAQLEQASQFIEKKIEIANWYRTYLQDMDLIFHSGEGKEIRHSYWMCSIMLKNIEIKDALRKELARNGVETRPVFHPVHTMPMYANQFEKHKTAEEIGWRGINLPSYPQLTERDISFITNVIGNFLKKKV